MKRSLFSRWTHRRALSALGLTALLATAIVYATRREDDAPYAPGEAVEGITSVHKRSASEAAWDIRFTDVARERGLAFSHFQGGKRSTQLPEDMGSGAAFTDVDGDGKPDIHVAGEVSEGALFMNAGDGLFEDREHQSHVADYRSRSGFGTRLTLQAHHRVISPNDGSVSVTASGRRQVRSSQA